MSKKLLVLLTVLVLAALVVSPAAAGIAGPGASGIQIQNLSNVDNTVSVRLWGQNGNNIDLGSFTIKPAAATNIYMPNYNNVPSGAYAMVATASQQVAAIARTDWSQSGGAAIYSTVDPATDVIIPLVVKNYANQTSQFTIQNSDTGAAAQDVRIQLFGRGSATVVKELANQNIGAGTSKTYSLNDAAFGTLPDTALDTGASGFVGYIRVTSSKGLVVQSYIDLAGSAGVSGFSGVPANSASNTLYCPLIRANYYGDTGISLVNTGGAAVSAKIDFIADAGSPSKGTFSQTISVPANSSVVAFQGPGGNSRAAGLPGGSQTGANPTPTNNGFYGVAKITATGGNILAVVNDTVFGEGWAVQSQSTYNCVSASQAGTKFALPLMRAFHLADTKLTTGVQIQNTSGSQITARFQLYNWNGEVAPVQPQAITIPANGSGNFWNGNLQGLPTVPVEAGGSGWYGSAVLTIEGGSAVVVVSDEGYGGTRVDSANYNALRMP